MKSIFHRYYCGCIGIPVDSQNALVVKACDDDSAEYFIGFRDMTDKESEPMKWEDQAELIREMSNMLARWRPSQALQHLDSDVERKPPVPRPVQETGSWRWDLQPESFGR